ncbi:MAG: hypothetical protein EAZ99_12910 [Alphaproteobacteria bacterium]|nr:MAG: hypothetical protein EAZ99_12910 [Alphaproteobacteria bacterium]
MYQSLVPLSKSAHATLRWTPPRVAIFAANLSFIPIAPGELVYAIAHMPVGFLRSGNRITLGVISGLGERNLFIGTDGKWVAGYQPALLRCYPFALQMGQEGATLMVDIGSVCVSDSAHLPILTETGGTAPEVERVTTVLTALARGEAEAQGLLAAVAEAGLLAKDLVITKADGTRHQLQGLSMIDPADLAALDGDKLQALHRAGALSMAYMAAASWPMQTVLAALAKPQPQTDPSLLGPEWFG